MRRDNASRFLTVVPTEPALSLKDAEMQIAVCYRLGIYQALPKAKGLACSCSALLANDPFHGVSCGKYKRSRVIARHDAVKDSIVKWIKRGGNAAAAEPRELNRDMDKKIRPDFECSLGASKLVGDIVVMDPAAPSNVRKSNPMKDAAQGKVKKFAAFVGKAAGLADKFVPAIFETFGGFSKDAVAFIAQTGKAARGDVIEPQYFIDGLTNEIAVAIQRGNAACVLNCLQEALQVVDPSDDEKSQLL